MNGIKGFFDSFKEFIWDIIGYLLPGSYVIILLSICINEKYFVNAAIGNKTTDLYPYVFIVVAYLIGHVTYGFGWLKEKMLGKFSYREKIETKVSKRKAFSLAKNLISKALMAKGISDDLSDSSLRDIRSLAMSFIPEQDQKIYSFTFRSELSNQSGNISIIIGILGLIFSIFPSIPWKVFNTDTKYVLLYLCLIISYFFLRQTRNRFYEISISLPFSIYTSTSIK